MNITVIILDVKITSTLKTVPSEIEVELKHKYEIIIPVNEVNLRSFWEVADVIIPNLLLLPASYNKLEE